MKLRKIKVVILIFWRIPTSGTLKNVLTEMNKITKNNLQYLTIVFALSLITA